jgi:hypothetical protein
MCSVRYWVVVLDTNPHTPSYEPSRRLPDTVHADGSLGIVFNYGVRALSGHRIDTLRQVVVIAIFAAARPGVDAPNAEARFRWSALVSSWTNRCRSSAGSACRFRS